LIAAGLVAGVLVACQAPGFMGLNGETAIPGLGLESYTLARVPIRVMLPADVVPGRHTSDRPEVPAEGAKVYLALDPQITSLTDAEGIAPLTIPVNGIQLIRAEIRTASGTMRLEGMMGLPFSREREQKSGPNTVSLPSMRELNEPLTLSLASTLVAAHLQERYTPEQIRYLDPAQVLTTTREVSQALKLSTGGYRTASLPDLTDADDVRRVAQELLDGNVKVREAFRQVFTARVPDLMATPSATASAQPEASASAEATPSLTVAAAGADLFPLVAGTQTTYTLIDAEDNAVGQVVRTLTKVTEKSDGKLASGRVTLTVDGKTTQARFMLKLQANRLKLSMPYRPELTYPLPFTEESEWIPAPGLLAKATRVAGEQDTPDTWTVTITGNLKGKPVSWTELYQPEVGLVGFTWGNDAEAPMARIVTPAE
jgi:hypothetical protein